MNNIVYITIESLFIFIDLVFKFLQGFQQPFWLIPFTHKDICASL